MTEIKRATSTLACLAGVLVVAALHGHQPANYAATTYSRPALLRAETRERQRDMSSELFLRITAAQRDAIDDLIPTNG